jgi:hypothetical protein
MAVINLVEDTTAPVTFDSFGNLNVTAGSSYVIRDFPGSDPFKHNGNILVTGSSSLSIINSSVVFKPNSYINITGDSSLLIENSDITVDVNSIQAIYNLFFQVQTAQFTIRNSTMTFPGTLNVSHSDFIAINTVFDQLTSPANIGSPYLNFNSSDVLFQDSQVKNFERYKDVDVSGDSNFTAINTHFDLDYQDDSVLNIDHTSTAMLYGITIKPGTHPYTYSPFKILSSNAWINIYRWLFLNVTDLLNTPIGNTTVTARNINLDQIIPVPSQNILDYLNKGANDFNITNSSGYILLPLLTDNITFSSSPNSIFVGNYELTAYHNQFNTTMNIGLTSFPILTDGANNPQRTLKFDDLLISPVNNTYFSSTGKDIVIDSGKGTIVNSIYQKPQGGVVNMTYGQQGNIEVTGGILELVSTGLGLEQDANNRYYVFLDGTGMLNLSNQSSILDGEVTPGRYPIHFYADDSSEILIEDGSSLDDVKSLGIFDNSKITMKDSTINGGLFYALGQNKNLHINAMDNSKINVTTLSISDAMVNFENSNISTKNAPFFSDIEMTASNSTFDHPLTFSNSSSVTFINISEPNFFNISAKDTSTVDVYWWLTVVVMDSKGNRLSGATVTVYNYTYENNQLSRMFYDSGVSDQNGEVTLATLGGEIYYDSTTGKVKRRYGGIIGNYQIEASYGGSRSRKTSQVSTDVFGNNQNVVIVIEGGPDLIVSGISPIKGVKGEDVKIVATIQNIGSFNATNIEVEFWDMENDITLGEIQHISELGAGKSTSVFVSHNFLIEDIYPIRITVDPKNLIGEVNELNNIMIWNLTIENLDKPDLTFAEDSLFTQPPSPISNNSKVTIGAYIRNVGNADADNFKVRFIINNTGVNPPTGFQVGNDTIVSGLDALDTTVVYADTMWTVNDISTYMITAIVDVENALEE